MATLLLELFSEEIPSRMQRAAAEQLQQQLVKAFTDAGLAPSESKPYVSPRHLAVELKGLPALQPDRSEERKGPKVGAPQQAIDGFLKGAGVALDQCEQRVIGKDTFYVVTIERKGRKTAEVAKEIIEAILPQFGWPKSMHWGSRDTRPAAWVRPLHRITCLLDDQVVPVQFAHLTASNITEGHRFLAPATITIPHAEQYAALLEKAHVKVDRETRRAFIAKEIATLAASAKLSIVPDEALLDEVTGLVEWPVPLLGTFDQKFLDLPPEVLISEMKVHQRYFALQDGNGKLTNQFIAVANMITADQGKAVIAGNARVLRARLSDGEFYWEQDKKTNLEAWGKKLSDVVFHAKVGMMDQKVARIESLAEHIAKAVGFSDLKSVKRTAQLCKADLTSGMVGEFPELQGIMGRYYALAQGESATIADAIRDHYKPLGANDSVPEAPLAAIVAVADKLDSILSLFAAGEKPTGSKDPLALRRAALGILRIVYHHGWNLDLAALITDTKNKSDIVDFFRDRLQNLLRDDSIRHDIIDAVLSGKSDSFIPTLITLKAHKLQTWSTSTDGVATIAAIKRTMNILAAEEKKDKTTFAAALAPTLTAPAEQALVKALGTNIAQPQDLDALTAPINQFFTDLLVNDPASREARLGLLASIRAKALQITDFSKFEG